MEEDIASLLASKKIDEGITRFLSFALKSKSIKKLNASGYDGNQFGF